MTKYPIVMRPFVSMVGRMGKTYPKTSQHPTPAQRYRKLFFLLPFSLIFLGCTGDPVREKPVAAVPVAGKATADAQPATVPVTIERPVVPVIWDRLRKNFAFDIPDNTRIAFERNSLLKQKRYLQKIQENAAPWLRLVLDEIEERKLPGELALIPFMESAYRADAQSPYGMAGLWQFTSGTGRLFGLDSNWWYDERRDAVSSTEAALNYFSRLNRNFNNDWELTLAAYNAGDGTVAKAIKTNRSKGKPAGYWSLNLPKTTKGYIPKLYALAQIFSNPEAYGIQLEPIPDQHQIYVADTGGQLDLGLAAKLAGIELGVIKQLNPAYGHWASNPKGPHRLMLPDSKSEVFRKRLSVVPKEKWLQIKQHPVQKGETLANIAGAYHTQIEPIKLANDIKDKGGVKPGQIISVPAPYSNEESYLIALNAIEKSMPPPTAPNTTANPEQKKPPKDPVNTLAKQFQGIFTRKL